MSPRPEDIEVAEDELMSTPSMLAHPPKGEQVVISGCSGSFPDSDGMYMFRDKLMSKVDLVTSDDRRWVAGHPEIPQRTGKLYNLEKFDAGFFGVHSKQAHVMDPMMRVAYERVYEAIVDAGVNPASLRGTNTAVFNGTCFSESEKTWFYDHIENDGLGVTNCSRGAMANRISYWLGLNSLSCVTDTACSSTLYALEKAYFSMRLGHCDAAIVLGATVCLHPFVSLQFARLGVLSPDGKCKCFDYNADGYCRSEAIPAVFLQKAKDAKRVYARIVHAKVNCDGFKEQGITFPSRKMQLQLLKEFYQECAIDPATVSFVEAHGTGTKVGDPEECNTLDEVFCTGRKGPLLIGSVKSNMGHSEPSSGLSSVAKAIITLETGIIPPNLHYSSPREGIPGLTEGRLKVVTDPTPLPGNKGLIGVNSFGFGGANAHILLEWNHKSKIQGGAPLDNIPRLVTVSGRHEDAVQVIFDDLKSRSLDAEFVHLLNELHSDSLVGHNARGFAILTCTGEKQRVIRKSPVSGNNAITFVFPGLGGQALAMGKSLMKLPPFAASIDLLSKALSFTDIDLYSILTDNDAPVDNILNSTLATVACQIGLVDSLAAVGVYPKKVLAYSIGEIACAYALRNLTADQSIKVAYFIGKSMLEAPVSNTSTIQVDLGKHEIIKYQSSGVEISAINSLNNTSLVGPINTIRRLKQVFSSKDIRVEDINLSGAGLHSHYVSEIESKLTADLRKVIPLPMPRSEKWVSTASRPSVGHDVNETLCSAEYFVHNLLNPVQLEQALNELPQDGIILDIGPKNWLKEQLVAAAVSSQYIDMFDSLSPDCTIQFLAALGTLYLSETELTLSNLYPAVEYPVSRGTPMISPLVRWDHRRNWFVNKFAETGNKPGGETKFTVSLKNEDDAYIAGHMIDGRVLYPATGYVNLIADVMRDIAGDIAQEQLLVLEDINFHRATPLTDANHEFTVSVERTTGNFEILEGGALVVSGKAFCPDDKHKNQHWADDSVLRHNKTDDRDAKKTVLSKKDIYKELRLRGYNYTGLFRGLDTLHSTGNTGLVSWNSNWVAFMDTMLQIQILNIPNRDLFVPTYIGKIIIDPKSHFFAVKECEDVENPKLPIDYYRDVDVIKAGGVEIWNLRAQQIPRRKPMEDAVLETYTFTPHIMVNQENDEDGLLKATRLFVHLALENLPGVKVKVLELADEALPHESALMAPCVSSVLFDLPLIQADVRVVSSPESHHGKAAQEYNVTVDEKALQTEKDCSIIIGADLLTRVQVLEQSQAALKDSGFLISRDKSSAVASAPNLTVLAEYSLGNETIKLLRKNRPEPADVKVIFITSDDSFTWIAPLKEALSSSVQQVIAVSQNDDTNGILGLINCLLREPSGEKLRCVYIRDKSAAPFDIKLPFYSNQLRKNLVFNVYQNGVWGSYRHQALPNQVAVPSQHVYITNRVKGDLSSFTLFQGPFNKYFEKLSKQSHVKVYYAALNFKDVMVASGKIVIPGSLNRSNDLNIGFEFSGINEKGERVMGTLPCGALVTFTDEVKPYTTWKIPDGLSLEDAATIPVVYLTVYRAIVVSGKAKRGESILIHAGAGGVGIAAINVSLKLGLQIFTTVGSAEKRKFLHDNYPQIPDSHIGNSRDISFEDMIKRETGNRGVDLVLNSLADEKMEASLRCLAYKGRFLEIGKYDLQNNVPLAAEPFMKNISYSAIMLDVALSGDAKLQKHLENDMADLMRLDLIKPLPRTTFDFNQPEQAIRYMTTGKHIGKVLLKVRDENEAPEILPTFDAVPRYFCNPDASYIIIGGLGGFGLELSNWLVSRGARALVVTSRTGVQNGYQGYRILAWESVGTRVLVSTDDISSEEGVETLLNQANALAPVAGIFNLAVVLKDSVFENQTEETFRESFAGKAKATAILDKLSRRLCPNLEDFVVFSSVSCGRGNPGQSNYGMSNSVMERICEKRKSEGLPGLAVQWGAIGEVGLVAEMAETNQTLVIGGTLQQTIGSCLQCMDTFLTQNAPVVASMVVAEKRSARKAGATMVETVGSILGIRDLKTLSHNTSLSELGMDSMTAVEIKQTLEREFEVFLSAQDLRGMTFAKLAALDSAAASGTIIQQGIGLNVLVQDLPPQVEALKPAVVLNEIVSKNAPVFFVPGFDGLTSTFGPAAKSLKKTAVALNYPHKCEENTSIAKTAQLMLPELLASLPDGEDFNIVGYSAGALVALEMANLLEATGRKGHLVLVDGSPALMSGLLKALQIGESQDEMENALLTALQDSLVPGEKKTTYSELKSWHDKLMHLDSLVANNTEHSKEYLIDYTGDLLGRLKNLIEYQTGPEKSLKSKISLIKPEEATYSGLSSEDFELSAWSVEPVEVFVTKGNHITMWSDSQMASILSQMF